MGSALCLARKKLRLSDYNGLIVTDLFNLADFLALTGTRHPPVMVYFHENQLTYPPPPGDKNAALLGMVNISTALAADSVAFNSTLSHERVSRRGFHISGPAARLPARPGFRKNRSKIQSALSGH